MQPHDRPTPPPSHGQLEPFEKIAALMDRGVRVPGIGIHVPLDPLIGLIPGIGDIAPWVLSFGLLARARQLGVPESKLRRMLINTTIDAAVGSIPIAGDIFDFFFKAHRRNLKIVQDHLAQTTRHTHGRPPNP